jgi:hypothetical protein
MLASHRRIEQTESSRHLGAVRGESGDCHHGQLNNVLLIDIALPTPPSLLIVLSTASANGALVGFLRVSFLPKVWTNFALAATLNIYHKNSQYNINYCHQIDSDLGAEQIQFESGPDGLLYFPGYSGYRHKARAVQVHSCAAQGKSHPRDDSTRVPNMFIRL